jgi:hypothetical protein
MSPRKIIRIPRRATNVDDFKKDVLTTMYGFYDRGYPTAKEHCLRGRK